MDKYKKYQFIASICVAMFIVSFALCILVMNRSVYNKCAENYKFKDENSDVVLSEFEAKLGYEQLADDFTSFFKGGYSIEGYDILGANVERLNTLKSYYRWAWVISILSFGGAVYSFIILSKRRYYAPLLYGGLLAAFLTSTNAFFVLKSDKNVLQGIRNMIFSEDYSYFITGDIVTRILPPEFARFLSLTYILIVFILILVMVLIRRFIIYCGGPHKF